MEENSFTYNIIDRIGVLTEDRSGFRKEINLIAYNGKEPVIDIRTWTPRNTMSKGITLNKEAYDKLVNILKQYEWK